jgi:glycosyltransferase involved in cell wall biosynthesis
MTAKYRRISDIFVLPSRSEGQGISFMSTMASGLPIVATQEGGIADFLFDEKRNPAKPTTGWAVDKNSPAQIAAAVKDILTHPEKAKIATDNARRLVEQDYNWDTISKDMREKVFARVL